MRYVSKKKKKAQVKKRLLSVLTVVFACVFAFSGYKLIVAFTSYGESKESYEELEQYVNVDVNPDVSEETAEETDTQEETEQEEETAEKVNPYELLQNIGADFDRLASINSDVVAWLTIDGTKLNYPMVQCDDNEYYLKHLFTRDYNGGGCIFLDYRNESDFSSRHSIVYGHRMDDGSMFSCVQKYDSQSYFDAHPYAILLTPSGNYVVEFFSGYLTDVYGDPWDMYFDTDEDYQAWLDSQLEKSLFTGTVTPTVTDNVITLSTCSHAFEDARFVLHGVLRQKTD